MGEVWAARHRPRGQSVAVKILTARRAQEEEFRASFRNESRLVAGLDHPNIVRVYDYGTVSAEDAARSGGTLGAGAPWLAMEQVEGGTLRSLGSHLGWPALRAVTLGLLDALAHAHARGVVHRDIKPSNVLLSREKKGLRVKLADFGVAHGLHDQFKNESALSMLSGTPAYMAPEQFLGQWRDYGPWTDLYAVGCLVWTLTTGQHLFRRDTLEDRAIAHLKEPLPAFEPRFEVPDGLADWLQKALQKPQRRRFQRAADASRALRAVEKGTRFPPPSIPRSWRPKRTDPRPQHLLGAGLGLFGVRAIPLVDREPERDLLWGRLIDTAIGRETHAVVLRGPSGCGKSRLAQWVCERAHEVGAAEVLRAQHSQLPSSGHGLGAMVARWAGTQLLEERSHVEARLQQAMSRLGLITAGDRDVLTEWIRPVTDDETAAGVRAIRFGSATERFIVLHRLLERLTQERPVVLWLDDVQWGLDALHFASWLLQRPEPLPVLIVLTVTDDELDTALVETQLIQELQAHPAVVTATVGPLERRWRPVLIERLLGLEPALANRVEQAINGHPMFAVQLLGDLVERKLLEPGPEGYRLAAGAHIELRTDLQEVWQDRIARLLEARPDREAMALELAAVLGREVHPREWLAVCDKAGARPKADLVEALLDNGLAECGEAGPEAGWSFVHNSLLEALRERSHRRGRLRTLHRLCANLLSESGRPDVAERLGRHLIEAGDPHAAVEPLLEAIENKLRSGEYDFAVKLIAVREDALTAAEVAQDNPLWGEGWLARFRIETRRGNYEEAERYLAHTKATAHRHGWRTLKVVVECERGKLARLRSAYLDAVALLEGVEDDAVALQDPALLAELHAELAEALSETGELARAELHARKAMSHFTVLGSMAGRARCWQVLADLKRLKGDLDRAAELLATALDLHDDAGERWGMASACNALGDLARYRGAVQDAKEWYARSTRLFRAIGSMSAAYPQYNGALMLLAQEQLEQARPIIEDCLETFVRQGRVTAQADAHLALAACATGDWERWDGHFGHFAQLSRQSRGTDEDTARLAERVADLADRAGQPQRAGEARAEALKRWRTLNREEEVRRVQALLP